MANYKETTGTATSWRRSNQVIIKNPLGSATKSIMFSEEDVVTVNGTTYKSEIPGVLIAEYNKDALIQLRDPATGEATGNAIPQQLVYQALYSLYLTTAEYRDVNAGGPDLSQTINLTIGQQPPV